jgi:hypothetical protein
VGVTFKDSVRGQRTQRDLLLQPVSREETVYRAVQGDPPTATDFLSHAALGHRPSPTQPYKAFSWFAVSMFATRETVDRFVQDRAREGKLFYTAEVRLRPGLGIYVVYRPKTKHLDVFGFPQDLLGCFATVV